MIEYYRVPPAKVATFYNVFRPAEIRRLAREPAPETAGLAPFIVACGRFVEAKGFDDLIRAFASVRARRPLKLVILGDGPLRAELAHRAGEDGVAPDVLLPGFEPNPFRYFARAAAFCLSSRWGEACPRVIVEAMACGTPVIASRCHWGPDELLDGDAYGLLYDPGNVEQLTDAIGRVLDDRRESARLVAAGLRRAEDFEESRILPRLEDYYCDGRRVAREHIMTA